MKNAHQNPNTAQRQRTSKCPPIPPPLPHAHRFPSLVDPLGAVPDLRRAGVDAIYEESVHQGVEEVGYHLEGKACQEDLEGRK